MKDVALQLAAQGWPVFPCSPADKRPLVGESKPGAGDAGLYRATTDREQIEQWWRQWPQAMIAVPTGAPIGAFVIDLDPKEGVTVDHLLRDIEQAIGEPLPAAMVVGTPRGGRHIYLTAPNGIEIGNRAGVIPHVDVRGTGGYVIVPPSVRRGAKAQQDGTEGRAYHWRARPESMVPPPASDAIVRFVTERRDRGNYQGTLTSSPPPAPADTTDDRVRKYALSALDAETRAVASCSSGGRNDTLNRAAYALGQLVGAGALSESAVVAALEDAAAACGLVREDGIRSVRATIRSGLRHGAQQPRDMSDVGAQRSGASRGRQTAASRGARVQRASEQPSAGGVAGAGGGEDAPLDPDTLAACAALPQNDVGNGWRLQRWFGADLLHVREVGWHFWAGTHWEAEGGGEAVMRYAQDTADRIRHEASYLHGSREDREAIEAAEPYLTRPLHELTDEQKALVATARAASARAGKRQDGRRKFAISSGNSGRIAGMINQAQPHITVGPQQLDADPLAINVRNGTLRLYSEVVREEDPECPDPNAVRYVTRKRWRVRLDPHNRDDRMTKVMPVEYDPDASCPRWLEFMQRFQPRETTREFLRMFHGYALTGMTGEQVFLYNYGLGANGKSTFMEALARLMGAYAQVLPAEAITGDLQRRGDQATPEFARLPGARLVRCAELPRGQGFRENTLKLLTGGEPILVRHLHARFFEFQPTFKAIGSGNDKPHIGGVDEGIWRRMKLVPWEVTIPPSERRPMAKVLAEFQAEGPGILNWLLVGLVRYLEDGWWVPPEVQAATDSYRSDMDPVGEFCAACVVRDDADGKVTARDMYRAYVAWAHANSVKPFAEKTFAGIMVQKGYTKTMGRIRQYLHVRLSDVPDDPEADDDRRGGRW